MKKYLSKKFWSYMMGMHKFFVKESKTFIGVKVGNRYTYKFKDLVYYPVAYFKFMWYSLQDFRNNFSHPLAR